MIGAPNAGDMVRCVNAYETHDHLKEGETYKVHYVQFDRGKWLIKLVGVEGFWGTSRFVRENPDEQLSTSNGG